MIPRNNQDDEEIMVCKLLYERKIFPKVYQFVGWAVKKKINRDALLHTLRYCLSKRPENCWAYCSGTLKIVNGNFNEKEFQKKAKRDGDVFLQIANDLKKLYAKARLKQPK